MFAAVTDFGYVGRDSVVELSSAEAGAEVALPSARCERALPPAYGAAEDVPVEVRGAGPATRQVDELRRARRLGPRREADLLRADHPARQLVELPAAQARRQRPVPGGQRGDLLLPDRRRRPGHAVRDGFGYHRTYTGPEHEAAGLAPIDETARGARPRRGAGAARLPRSVHRGAGLPDVLPERDGRPGRRRELAFCDDPAHGWVRDTWATHAHGPPLPGDLGGGTDDGASSEDADDRHVRLTTAQALVRWMIAQRSELLDGTEVPLFAGVFAIFGHGNVLGLGTALHEARDELPTWRGQNEQGMALAAVAYARATDRRQVMAATSSIGPGALNMVTAAGVAHANRLPVLLLPGDTFAGRAPDPVLQQVEHFGDPTTSVNDAFRPVVALLRPDHPARAAARHAAAGRPRAHRPRRRGPGRRWRCRRTCRPRSTTSPRRCSSRGCTACPGRGPTATRSRLPRPSLRDAERPLLVARRRGALLGRRRRGGRLRRDARRTGRRDRRRPHAGAARPPACTAARSASSAPPRPTRSPPRPTSCSRSAPGCRTSPPRRGPASPPTSGSSPSTPRASTRSSTAPRPWSATPARSLVELDDALGDWVAPIRRGPTGRRAVKADWDAHDRPAPRRRAHPGRLADLRPGHRRRQRRQRAGRLRAHRVRRHARRAARRLAHRQGQARVADVGRDDGPRVRLLLHGLRGRRALGCGDGAGPHPPRRPGHLDLRRRLLPDAQLRALLRGLRRAPRTSRCSATTPASR